MTERQTAPAAAVSSDEVQQGWHDLMLRVQQLEADRAALEHENKTVRSMLERVIEHRQKSHNELVLILSALVSKLPINDVGVVVSRLVEHNASTSQYLASLVKGTVDTELPQPMVLKALDQIKRELQGVLKPTVEELIRLDTPLEPTMLQSLIADPETFLSTKMVQANRCFLKGHLPRERVVREFGEEALVLFNDLTTDPKLNPRPKPDEIVLGFKSDFETALPQQTHLAPEKREALLALYHRVQRSKAPTDEARCQRIKFCQASILLDLLHFYENQNTEAPDVVFAQRLPVVVEQMVLAGPQERLEETLIAQAESLIGMVVNPDHRQAIINNIGKGGGIARTLKFVLKLRAEKVPEQSETIAEFVRHLIPTSAKKPTTPAELTPVLRLIHPDKRLPVVRAIMNYDRMRKEDAETLGKAVGTELGLKNLDESLKAAEAIPPEIERQLAWEKIKEDILRRTDPSIIAAAIRDRLHAKYNADEIRQSWITLTEADAMSLIRIFCQVPYRPDGQTDSIARTVMETYVSRLTHEKYATIYNKVVNSLRNTYHVKADSPTLVTFLALVRWVSPEAASRICADVGMPVPA